MKPVPRICERIVKNGQMWCNTHDRPHSVCNGGPQGTPSPGLGKAHPLQEQTEGKVPAYGTKRAYTPPEGEG